VSVSVRARPGGPRTCPFCRDEAGEDVTPCACGVIYHPECRAELSRCATIGCAGKSATPGQRGAHRDVACVRCQGLINNDGDMCFGCWSPFHRTCLRAGCCAVQPAAPDPGEPQLELRPRGVAGVAASFLVFCAAAVLADSRAPFRPNDTKWDVVCVVAAIVGACACSSACVAAGEPLPGPCRWASAGCEASTADTVGR
jgi:hypothetical protein